MTDNVHCQKCGRDVTQEAQGAFGELHASSYHPSNIVGIGTFAEGEPEAFFGTYVCKACQGQGGDSRDLSDALNDLLEPPDDLGDEEAEEQKAKAIIEGVDSLLRQAIQLHASSLHIEPSENHARVRCKVDGCFRELEAVPQPRIRSTATRLKILGGLDITERRRPQQGSFQLGMDGVTHEFNLSTIPVQGNEERICLKIVPKAQPPRTLSSLGMGERNLRIVQGALQSSGGMIMVSGPRAAGKTSTLFACLAEMNPAERNAMVIGTHPEFLIPGLTQIRLLGTGECNQAMALRAALEHEPDALMLESPFDFETANRMIQAALSDTKILASLHVPDVPSILVRFRDMGIEPYLIGESVRVGIAQRLVRRLCSACRQKGEEKKDAVRDQLLTLARKQGAELETNKMVFYRPVGCRECRQTGFQGLVPLFEVMPMTPAIRDWFAKDGGREELRKLALKEGMKPLIADGLEKALAGLTTLEEIFRSVPLEDNPHISHFEENA